MKLVQRIAIGYYKTKIKATALVSMRKAAEKTFQLFCTPYSGKPKRKAPPVFHHAEKLNINMNGQTARGWRWTPSAFNGKRILIAHGFDSCSYKFDKYIQPLNNQGFEVLAFDAIAHGTSDGKTINAPMYRETIMAIDKAFGPLYGIMAHSFGGLAASLAAEQMPHLQKLVLIAPATETQTAIDNFFHFIKLPHEIKKELENYIVDFGGNPIPYYSVNRVVEAINIPVLWLHDEEDPICTFEDVKPTIAKQLKHVEVHATKGLGHSKIYRDNEVNKKVVGFFAS
jgi:pimeloyl-ACP methyl ester carboxylesterase